VWLIEGIEKGADGADTRFSLLGQVFVGGAGAAGAGRNQITLSEKPGETAASGPGTLLERASTSSMNGHGRRPVAGTRES